MSRVMTTRGQELLDSIPPICRTDRVMQAIMNAYGDEFDLLDSAMVTLENNLFIVTADEVGLPLWEAMVGIVTSDTFTVADRRTAVMAFLQRMANDGSGQDWVATGVALMGTGWHYATHDEDIPDTPLPEHITLFLPFVEGTISADIAIALMRSVTPATVILNATYGDGFILDHSELDVSVL